MNAADLSSIAERVKVASPSPWVVVSDGVKTDVWSVMVGTIGDDVGFYDGDFIANARDDVPLLVAEVVRLREGIQQALTLHSVEAREAHVIADHLQGLLSEVRA